MGVDGYWQFHAEVRYDSGKTFRVNKGNTTSFVRIAAHGKDAIMVVTGDKFGVDGVISVPRSAFMDALKEFQAEEVPTTPSPRDPSAVLAAAAEIARQRFEQRQAEGKAPFDVIEGTK